MRAFLAGMGVFHVYYFLKNAEIDVFLMVSAWILNVFLMDFLHVLLHCLFFSGC